MNRKMAWILVCFASAVCAGFVAYSDPNSFLKVSGILASVLSVLVGVSLAIIAVLSTPFQANVLPGQTRDDTKRLNASVASEEVMLTIGQLIIFYSILFSLVLVIVLNWVAISHSDIPPTTLLKLLSALTASFSVFSLLWSAWLPYLLFAISKQRRDLS